MQTRLSARLALSCVRRGGVVNKTKGASSSPVGARAGSAHSQVALMCQSRPICGHRVQCLKQNQVRVMLPARARIRKKAMAKRIFITEDEEDIREVIKCTLESFSYEIQAFESAEECLEETKKNLPDLILMDIMLPGMDGITALEKLKSQKETQSIPVIMLTAKSSEVDKVTGLDKGADDYVTKPFGVLELAARVRAALRKSEAYQKKSEVLTLGGITLDADKRTVTKNGEPVELTLKEFELLRLLMENKDRVLPRETLLDEIWGYDYVGETRTLDMHVRTLRGKLGDNGETQRYIKTVRGVGYRFIGASEA